MYSPLRLYLCLRALKIQSNVFESNHSVLSSLLVESAMFKMTLFNGLQFGIWGFQFSAVWDFILDFKVLSKEDHFYQKQNYWPQL